MSHFKQRCPSCLVSHKLNKNIIILTWNPNKWKNIQKINSKDPPRHLSAEIGIYLRVFIAITKDGESKRKRQFLQFSGELESMRFQKHMSFRNLNSTLLHTWMTIWLKVRIGFTIVKFKLRDSTDNSICSILAETQHGQKDQIAI